MGLKNFFVVLLAILFLMAIFLVLPPLLSPSISKKVIIPYGYSAGQIAEILKDEGIISHPWFFKIMVRFLGWEKNLQNGVYYLKPHSAPFKIARLLKKGEASIIRVTIPEGFNLEEIAGRFAGELGIPAGDFLAACRAINFREEFSFLPAGGNATVEGYLFPDTYFFKSFGITPSSAIHPMLKRFEEVVLPLWENYRGKIDLRRKKWDLYEVLTLASIVEKEYRLPEERPLIAEVFWNRLKKGLLLESCATVNYVLKKSQLILSLQDLKIRSPYNTYLYLGLPPGPISNPGLEAVKAVLNPDKGDYLYFVAAQDNHHVFSKTLGEHLRAQKKYLKINLEKQNLK